MSNEVRIEIARDELFDAVVDQELAKQRARRGGAPPPEAVPLSPLRRLLYSNLFYLPAAAAIGALVAWMIIEPYFNDLAHVTGQVMLANDDPFVYDGMRSLTVGDKEVLLNAGTVYEAGVGGEAAAASATDIVPGDTIEVVGVPVDQNIILAMAVRPTTAPASVSMPSSEIWGLILFVLTAVSIAFCLLVAEGIASRNWNRMLVRTLWGTILTVVFSVLALIPAGLIMQIGERFLDADESGAYFMTIDGVPAKSLFLFAVTRSIAWALVGTGVGLGMNLVRASRVELRNSVLGGALGGALGGVFFDPIDRFLGSASHFGAEAWSSRMVGLLAVGLGIGLFVALVDRLARVAWLRVRTGPLAGKAFVLYRSPTIIGSSSGADIYLFKDAEIDPTHARIHRFGKSFEIEDAGSRVGIQVAGRHVRHRRLVSGDQIVVGNTVLEFGERTKTTATG